MNEIEILKIDYLVNNQVVESEECNIKINKKYESLFRIGLKRLNKIDCEIYLIKREL